MDPSKPKKSLRGLYKEKKKVEKSDGEYYKAVLNIESSRSCARTKFTACAKQIVGERKYEKGSSPANLERESDSMGKGLDTLIS